MNRNKIIKIAVIVVAFGSSGLILYNGLFKKNSVPPPQIPAMPTAGPGGAPAPAGQVPALPGALSPQGSSIQVQEILPQGTNLDFSKVIDSKRFNYNQFQYPMVEAPKEVGIPENSLVLPILPVGSEAPAPNPSPTPIPRVPTPQGSGANDSSGVLKIP